MNMIQRNVGLSCLIGSAAICSLICRTWLAGAFVFGFGVGDTWVFYPPAITLLEWLVSLALISFPCWWFGRIVMKQKQCTLKQTLGAFVILAVILPVLKPLYSRCGDRQLYYDSLEQSSHESGDR